MSETSRAAPDAVERELRAPATDPTAWARARGTLVDRAGAENLIDVAVERHDSPIGRILLGATAVGLVRVGLPAEEEAAVLEDVARRVSPRILAAPRATLSRARHELEEYFEGRRRTFEVDLDWRLTGGFRREVLDATALIPFGRTATYREVATRAGRPAAVRAAGTALATNPLPIVVPCHRVLRTGGGVGSYRGGSEAKVRLLDLEGVEPEAPSAKRKKRPSP